MKTPAMWIGFLLVCFLLTGMVGLFASYGPSIPLQRALHRIEAIDRTTPDTGSPARAAIIAEAQDEEAGVGTRTRLMIFVVTTLSAALGTGILLLVARQKSN